MLNKSHIEKKMQALCNPPFIQFLSRSLFFLVFIASSKIVLQTPTDLFFKLITWQHCTSRKQSQNVYLTKTLFFKEAILSPSKTVIYS